MKIKIAVLFLILSHTFFSCKDKSIAEFYDKDVTNWINYLGDINVNVGLDNTLLLITYPSFCGYCLHELNVWNEKKEQFDDLNIVLIVVDRFTANASNFVESNNFHMDSYTDQNAEVLKRNLVSGIPKKVYFRNNEIIKVERIGDSPDYEKIMEILSNNEK